MSKQKKHALVIGLIGVLLAGPIHAAEYTGILTWSNRADLSLPVSGVIADIKVKAGDTVKRDEVLLALDKRHFGASLMAAKAMTSRYKPGRDEAKRELARAQELFDRTVLSQVELDKAKNDYAEKEALYSSALADYQRAQLDMEYSELKAPYDLVIVEQGVVKGQAVVNQYQAVPLITVADHGFFEIHLLVKPEDITNINLGKSVEVSVGSKKTDGQVVSLNTDSSGSRIRIRIRVDAQSIPSARVGHSATAKW